MENVSGQLPILPTGMGKTLKGFLQMTKDVPGKHSKREGLAGMLVLDHKIRFR